jgi:integrase
MARKPKYRRFAARDRGFVEHAGKRHYLPGEYGSTESLNAYRDFLKSLGFLVVDKREAAPAVVTLQVLAARFDQWAIATFPSGRRSYVANLRAALNLLLEFISHRPERADWFTPLKAKEFQQWMIAQGQSRGYINTTLGRIRRMFKWGVSEELIPVTAFQALATVPPIRKGRGARETVPRKPVPREHVDATLDKLAQRLRVMVRLQWLTGVRSQSLCQAKPEQFDTSQTPWQWHPRHKSEHLEQTLVVFIGPEAQAILGPILKAAKPGEFLFQPRNKEGKRAKRYRSSYDSTSYARTIKRAAKRAGVPHWSPHQLRHARATLVRERHGLEAAQAALGHARIDATQIYAQKQLALAKLVAETMG